MHRHRCAAIGFSLVELLIVVGLVIGLSAASVPLVASTVDASRTWGAAHYLAGRLNLARTEAVKRSAFVAMRIRQEGPFYRCTLYADGNGNGVRTVDINAGIDAAAGFSERLDEKFGGVNLGIVDGVRAVDSAQDLVAGSDPVRLGQSDLASFNPNGSATAGTIYIRGRGRQQAAVRILGVTGRIRVLWFNFVTRQWETR